MTDAGDRLTDLVLAGADMTPFEVPTDWATPLSAVPRAKVKTARLRTYRYPKGRYLMEAVEGYHIFDAASVFKVNGLEQRQDNGWKTWMVDDPVHWLGMRDRVRRLPAGKVTFAGLGLGLAVHHAIAERPDLEVTVVERNRDVIDLIAPTLPETDRLINIVVADFYQWIHSEAAREQTGILWDLAVGSDLQTRDDFIVAQANVAVFLPGTFLTCFGLQSGNVLHSKKEDVWFTRSYHDRAWHDDHEVVLHLDGLYCDGCRERM